MKDSAEWLPAGWITEIKTRKHGIHAGEIYKVPFALLQIVFFFFGNFSSWGNTRIFIFFCHFIGYYLDILDQKYLTWL